MKKSLTFLLLLFSNLIFAQRNVVLIIADDIGTDYFGFYADHKDTANVPNIRSLMAKGVLFTNATANPVCSATRAGILTGRYSFRTGVGGVVGSTAGSGQINSTENTIPKLLQNYNPTIGKAQIGKWHLNNPTPVGNLVYPNTMGFNHFEGPYVGAITDYYSWTKFTNGISSTVTNYATTEGVNNAIDWIKLNSSNPFFLWLAFNAPHDPLHLPPTGFYTTNAPLSGTQPNINQNPKKYLIADLEALDHELGRLFDSLQTLNLLDSTDFIFMGDNGNTTKTAQNLDPSRTKGTVYEYGVHVPFIISGPSVINPNRTSAALINTVDVFATVNELMGNINWANQIAANKPVDTKSIVPILLNQANSIRPWTFTEVFYASPTSNDAKAIRNVNYKLIRFDTGVEEFYNLALDTNELNNLLASVMTLTDSSNYIYLCTEMTLLLGSGNTCTNITGLNNVEVLTNSVYPNPFTNHIYTTNNDADVLYQLSNQFGQIIFKGNHINVQDFSKLPNGVFTLNIKSKQQNQTIKLLHLQ